MKDEAEASTSQFYNTVGWETEGAVTEDAKRWEDLRECAREYVSKSRLRVMRQIPERGENLLDMGSGPIQYDEYLEYSKNFRKRYCIDLSAKALDAARRKIGDHGVFLHGSFFEIDFDADYFDCAISLHVIYHIDKDRQEPAVRKLLDVTKPGKPVIIVYSNPTTLPRTVMRYLRFPVRMVKRLGRKAATEPQPEPACELYFYTHPISWWKRFRDVAEVGIFPWRSFTSADQKRLIPDNGFGKMLFRFLFCLEEMFPTFFGKHFEYPMIVLRKRGGS